MLQTIVRVCQIAFLVLATVALGWFLWGKFGGERRRELTPFERNLAERVVADVVEKLPREERIKRLLVMPVSGQELDGRMTDLLVDKLHDREEYDIVDARRYEGVLTPANVAEGIVSAQRIAKDARPDGILYSYVRRDIGRRGVGAEVDMESTLVVLDAKAKFPMHKVNATEKIDSRFSVDWLSPWIEGSSSLLRFILWIALTAGLPFAFFTVVQRVTRKENNRLNAVMLGSFVTFDVVLAFVLLGFRPGIFGWFLVLLAGLAGFVYNFVICDKIDDMRR